MKIVISGSMSAQTIELFLEEMPKEWNVEVIKDYDDLMKRTDVEILITRSFRITRQFIEQNKDLKFIQKWGVGLNTVDIEAAGEHGIPVSNVPGGNAEAVSEITLMLMLAVYRNFLYFNRNQRAGIPTKRHLEERCLCVKGKTVGIVGAGNIGRLVAKKVQAFEAKTIYYDAFRLSPEYEAELSLEYVSFEELLKRSDIVTMHVPLMKETEGMMGAEQFKMMKPKAIFINAARGGLVKEDELIAAIDSGEIMAAGLDCSSQDNVTDASAPVLNHPFITVTPHIGGSSADVVFETVPRMVENVARFVNGEEPLFISNKEYMK